MIWVASLFLLSLALPFSTQQEHCTSHAWTTTEHLLTWQTDMLQTISVQEGIRLTLELRELFEGSQPIVSLTVYAPTQEQAKAFSLFSNSSEEGMFTEMQIGGTEEDASSAFSLTFSSSSSSSSFAAAAAASVAAYGLSQGRGSKFLLAAVPAALWVGGALGQDPECIPDAILAIYLPPYDHERLKDAIAEGTVNVGTEIINYFPNSSPPDEVACSDPIVATNFPTSCEGIPVRQDETLETDAVIDSDFLLHNVFTYYDCERAPHQQCALEKFQEAIQNQAFYAEFTCRFRNKQSDCGDLITLTNIPPYYDTINNPHQKEAVEYLQREAEKMPGAWQTLVDHWRNTVQCFNWKVRNDGRCGPKFGNAGCNPNRNYCCSPFGWCGSTDDHCVGGKDYRNSISSGSTESNGGSVTITGKKCSANHPDTDRNGACIEEAKCEQVGGTSVVGLCPNDPVSIRCCDGPGFQIQRPQVLKGHQCSGNHPQTQRRGVCMKKTECTSKGGTTESGLCPNDPADILCCDGQGFELEFPSDGNLCGEYVGKETMQIEGNGGRMFTVTKILPNHLTNPGIYYSSPSSKDNTIEVETACAFSRMRSAALDDGVTILITSGFRTYKRQEYFWNCYQCQCCNNGNLAARPGTSRHGIGVALDVNTNCGRGPCGGSAVYQWLDRNAASYKFFRTVPSEPWHWEYHPDW